MRASHFLLALFLIDVGAVDAQQPRVSLPRASAQVVAGTVAIPIGVLVPIGIEAIVREVVPRDPYHAETWLVGGVVVGATIAPALAVTMVGTGGAPHGSGAHAFSGAVAGYAVDVAIEKLTHKTGAGDSRVGLNPWFLANLVPPAIGATLAYDVSHR